MVGKINGQLATCYSCPDKKTKIKKRKNKYYVSLFGIMVGIFLLPNVAYLSSVSTEKLIELTNNERVLNEVAPLIVNDFLTEAANNKADDIIESQIFKHNFNDRKFSNWIKDVDYEYSYVGENLAIDFITSEGVINAWKNSELHNKNLINPRFKEIGIAINEGSFEGHEAIVVVQIFGDPANSSQGKISSIDSLSNLYNLSAQTNPTKSFTTDLYEVQLAGADSFSTSSSNHLYKKDPNESGIMSSTPISILNIKNKYNINSGYLLFIFYVLTTTIFSLLVLPILFINAFYSEKLFKNLFHYPAYRKHIHKENHSQPIRF